MPTRAQDTDHGLGPVRRWATAEPEVIVAYLASGTPRLDAAVVGAIRDRAATFYHAQPARAFLIAAALIKALRRQGDSVEPAARAVAWRCHAEACMFTGRMPQARRAYERATEEARGDGALTGQILVGRVNLLSLLGQAAEARQLAARAERLLTRAGDLVYLGKLHLNQGNAHYQQDRYAEALVAYQKAAVVFERARVRDATTVVLALNQGIACTNLARIDEARRYFLHTEARCEKLGLAALGAHARYNRSFLEALRGDYRQALMLLEAAEQVFEDQGIRDMGAASQRARAEIYLDLGMPGEARDLAARAAVSFTQQGMTFDAALCRTDEARGLLMHGENAAARALLAEADAFFRSQGHRPRRAAVLLLEAHAMLREDPASAARLASLASRSLERMKAWRARSAAGRLLAEARLAAARPDLAQRALAPVRQMARRLPIGERMQVWALAGRIARERQRDAEALQYLRRATKLLEAERRLIPGTEVRARAFEDRVRVYHDLIAVTLRGRRPSFDEIFRLVEAARARGFRERAESCMAQVPAVRGPRGARGARLAAAGAHVTAQRARLSSLTRRLEEAEYPERGLPDPALIRTLQAEIQASERSLADQIRRAQLLLPAAAAWRGAAGADEIAQQLATDEAMVEYFLLGEQVLALVLTRGGRAYRFLPVATAALGELVERFRFQLDALALAPQPDSTLAFRRRTADIILGELYDALVRPLPDLLPAVGRLIVVPHGFLHRVPFECLRDGVDYVDARYVVSRCPTSDALLRRGRRSRKRGVLLCGSTTGGPAAVGAELDEVAAHFSPSELRVLRDPAARAVLDAMAACRIIHLSTHGTFREDNPLFSRLSTIDGGLFLIDLLDNCVTADLVVLSACNSGQVFTGRGDDLSGVAHGFLAAGARQLVASTWRVHDGATRQLMAAFYRHLGDGGARGPRRGDPAAALAAAGREVRATWDHPFYWASFSVYGA